MYRSKKVKFYRVDYMQIYDESKGWLDLEICHELTPQGQILERTTRYCNLDYIISGDEGSDNLLREYINRSNRLDFIIDQLVSCLTSIIKSLKLLKVNKEGQSNE